MFSKTKSAKFLRMALSATFFAYIAVLFNAYTRISEASLGCPDWPGCYESQFQPMTAREIREAAGNEDTGEVSRNRAWKDMIQRYIAAALGLILIRLAFLGWRLKKRKRNQQYIIPAVVMLLVFALAVLGMLTIGMQFKPLVQMVQLLGGLTILGLLWWIVMREQRFWRAVTASEVTRSLRPRTLAGLFIVALLIALGGWSSVNFAGFTCPDFPTCQSQWWPPADYTGGFTLWRERGIEYDGGMLSLESATAIHMAHRAGALIALLYVGWLAFHVLRVGVEENLCRYGFLILLFLLASTALGIMDVVMRLPVAVAVTHNGMAALLLMSMVTLYHAVRPPRNI